MSLSSRSPSLSLDPIIRHAHETGTLKLSGRGWTMLPVNVLNLCMDSLISTNESITTSNVSGKSSSHNAPVTW